MHVIPLDAPPAPIEEVGGKGHSLMRMTEAGLRVPSGFVLTTEFFDAWLDALRPGFDALSEQDVTEVCADLQARARELALTETQRAAVEVHVEAGVLYAVRSSSPEEDLAGSSFAGGYETILGVGSDGMGEAIARAFASCLAERIVVYKRERGLDPTRPSIAVVVQRMVRADVAGVAFSLNPTTNDFDEVVINANPGLGETVVSGQVTPDQFVVDRVSMKVVDRQRGARELCMFLEEDGSIREEHDVDFEWTLTDDQLVVLTRQVVGIEVLYGVPMDIEWGMEDGTLYLLQARPITTYVPLWREFQTEPGEPRQIWVDYTLIEQGLTEPFTVLGSSVYDWFMKTFDVAVGAVDDLGTYDNSKKGKLARMGKTLTNVSVVSDTMGWKRTVELVEAMDPTSADILRGIDEDKHSGWDSGGGIPLSTIRHAPVLLFQSAYVALFPARANRWLRDQVDTVYDGMSKPPFTEGTIRERTVRYIDRISGDFSLVAGLLLGRFGVGRLEKMFPAEDDPDVRALTQSMPGNVTIEMGIAIADLALTLPDEQWTSERLATAITDRALPEEWLSAWDEFMRLHGCRGPREIDAGSPRFRDRPGLLVNQLLAVRELPPGANARDHNIQVQEEREPARQRLRAKLPFYKRPFFDYFYQLAYHLSGLRETPKYAMIRILDGLRQHALRDGEVLAAAGRIDDPDDIVHLTTEDIHEATIDPTFDVRERVRVNREFMDRLCAVPEQPRVMDSRGRIYRPEPVTDGDTIQGTPISAGVVRGKVKVLTEPLVSALEQGDILVTRATDPGWTPLFPVAGGILLEVGGTLQHGALVAREYGKPCVVGIPGITRLVEDGDIVELDGAAGTVRRVQSDHETDQAESTGGEA